MGAKVWRVYYRGLSVISLVLLVLTARLLVARPASSQSTPVQVEPPSSTIWGKICEDTNQDGACDSGEPPLPFVSIALLDEDLDEVDTFTSGYAGVYEFTVTDIESGDTYYVVETDPPGYTSVNSNVIEVEVEPGERIYAGDFCDYPESVETPTPTPPPMTTPTATRTSSFTPTPSPTSTPTLTLTPTITPTNGGWVYDIHLPVVLVGELTTAGRNR